MHPQTRLNLLMAMRGEAYTYARYLLFADQARACGRPDLAAVYEEAARAKRLEHFVALAALVGLPGDEVANLRLAIDAESFDVTAVYPALAAAALRYGDESAAALFTAIARDSRSHLAVFQAAVDTMALPAR